MLYRVLMMGVIGCAVCVQPALAQQKQNPDPADAPLNLPRWAEPLQQPAYAPGEASNAPAASTPAMPPAPTQVPVDGGLSILAAAGAGYALYRLRRRGEESETFEHC